MFGIVVAATAATPRSSRSRSTPTPEVDAIAVRWIHVPIAVLTVALAGFAFHDLGAGRRWRRARDRPASAVAGINFSVGQNLNRLEVEALRDVVFLGVAVRVAVGVTTLIGDRPAGRAAADGFFIDASVTAWRQAGHAAAVVAVAS